MQAIADIVKFIAKHIYFGLSAEVTIEGVGSFRDFPTV